MTLLGRRVVVMLTIGVLALVTHVDAQAQGRLLRGTVTDEWGQRPR